MNIGYARVSTEDQNPDLQLAALKQVGCQHILIEKATGAHDRCAIAQRVAADAVSGVAGLTITTLRLAYRAWIRSP